MDADGKDEVGHREVGLGGVPEAALLGGAAEGVELAVGYWGGVAGAAEVGEEGVAGRADGPPEMVGGHGSGPGCADAAGGG